jgi:hypothetical protein
VGCGHRRRGEGVKRNGPRAWSIMVMAVREPMVVYIDSSRELVEGMKRGGIRESTKLLSCAGHVDEVRLCVEHIVYKGIHFSGLSDGFLQRKTVSDNSSQPNQVSHFVGSHSEVATSRSREEAYKV